MEFEYGFKRNYTTTITRAVGPTTQTGVRGTLPQPAPDDTNAIWLAKNGNDANAGTEAAPKLTLAGALAATTGAKPTIHIFRNAFVGDLVFTFTGNLVITGRFIQVEEGEIATLESDGTGGIVSASPFDGIVNGCIITTASDFASAPTSTINLQNCFVTTKSTSFAAILPFLGRNLPQADYTIFYNPNVTVNPRKTEIDNLRFNIVPCYVAADLGAIATFNYNNCIFVNKTTAVMAFEIENNSASTFGTINFDRCYFVNAAFGVYHFPNDGVVTPTNQSSPGDSINLTSCGFINCTQAGIRSHSSGANLHNIDISLDFCALFDTPIAAFFSDIYDLSTAAQDSGVVIASTNQFLKIPALLSSLAAGLNGNTQGFRLQAKGKTTIEGFSKYFLDSPLIGAGLAGADISAWDESTALTSEAYDKLTEIAWPPKSFRVAFVPQNPLQERDVNGNLHTNFDSIRKRLEFTFDSYTSNENAWKMVEIMNDRGSKRFYPRGAGITIFDNASDGLFDATTNEFVPALTVPMKIGHWAGFWITIEGLDYYIESNTGSALVIADKLGVGLPTAGAHTFTIEYLLVQSQLNEILIQQEHFTNFLNGGAWAEKDDLETKAFEYNGLVAVFEEIEDVLENE